MQSTNNNKYKTVMCKHFEQNGTCYLGAKCHFAHGKEELRKMTDPLPQGRIPGGNDSKPYQNYQNFSMPPTVSNYKTMQCKFFEKGHCKFGDNCSFAHGDEDVRLPNSPIPQQAITNMQMNSSMMPNMYDTGAQSQIVQQQITYFITQLQEYFASDEEKLAKLKQASDLVQSNNVQAAASIAYGLIAAPRNQEESNNFTMFINNMQNLGTYLIQQAQMQPNPAMYGFNPQGLQSPQVMGMNPGMAAPYGANMNMGQSKPYGGGYKPHYQGKHNYQNNQGNENHQQHGDDDDDSENINMDMGALGNMMGNTHISGGPYQNQRYPGGGKPRYNANTRGNRGNQN